MRGLGTLWTDGEPLRDDQFEAFVEANTLWYVYPEFSLRRESDKRGGLGSIEGFVASKRGGEMVLVVLLLSLPFETRLEQCCRLFGSLHNRKTVDDMSGWRHEASGSDEGGS